MPTTTSSLSSVPSAAFVNGDAIAQALARVRAKRMLNWSPTCNRPMTYMDIGHASKRRGSAKLKTDTNTKWWTTTEAPTGVMTSNAPGTHGKVVPVMHQPEVEWQGRIDHKKKKISLVGPSAYEQSVNKTHAYNKEQILQLV